ncbi:MAG: hypothetical protein HQM08_19750 [Candidatus Riflebacteria bacterium]|nr:hypothetical protein [Candidatus Riflebacteria bacterium]
MPHEHSPNVGLAQALPSLLEELFGGDLNEATMTANFLIPILHKVFGEVQLEAECTMSMQFGVNTVTLDTKKSSGVSGRADFFLRAKTTRNIIAVVEAKKPSHKLTEVDDEQIKSYMRAVLPLVPFGFVVNANKPSRMFGWKDGDIVRVDETRHDPLASVPEFIDRALIQAASRALMLATPGYRDDAITQISRKKIQTACVPSKSPRTVVEGLLDRIKSREATVSFVTSPPKCGKSQALYDLAMRLSAHPIIFVDQALDQQQPMTEALQGFEVNGDLADSLILRFLKARPPASSPICILIDSLAPSKEIIDLIRYVSDEKKSNTHLVISATYQITLKLLFRDDFSPFSPSGEAIAILEIGGFTDKEVANIFSERYVAFTKTPFGRLLRWPGFRNAVSYNPNLGSALWSWFQNCSISLKRAMFILGADLAQESDWSTERLPFTFIRNQPQELNTLLECGFVIELPRPLSGLSSYGFACVEIPLYALLSHIFEVAPKTERAASLDALVARWKKVQPEQEMVALAAILPTFLAGTSGDPLDRIVRYMLSISFGSFVLETISRSDLFSEFATLVDSQVGSPQEIMRSKTSFELLRKALIIFRDRVGLMPDFAELERELGETVRFFDGKRNPILKTNLSAEQWQDRTVLKKMGKAALLDSLYLLSKGDTSWLPGNLEQKTVRLISIAISEVAAPHCSGFPLDSQIDDLVEIITRRYPQDLPQLMKSGGWSGKKLSTLRPHIRTLAELVLKAYRRGSWEFLSDCFANYQGMAGDLKEVLLTGLLGGGTPISFANVFVNAFQQSFGEFPFSIQEQILQRLMEMKSDLGKVVSYIEPRVLQSIRDDHPEVFMRISELVWDSGGVQGILRILAVHKAAEGNDRKANFWRLVSLLDITGLCTALSTPEFFSELFFAVQFPIVHINSEMQLPQEGASWELLLFALCLLDKNKEPLVSTDIWLQNISNSNLDIKDLIRNSPRPEMVCGIRWNILRCKDFVRLRIQGFIQRNELNNFDQILKSALLKVHQNNFNVIFVRVAIEAAREGNTDYRKLVAKRLIISGFDLWEMPNKIYPCPRLRDLLDEVAAFLSTEERRDWISWILHKYHRLRLLPLFSTYSINELLRTPAIQEEFLGAVFDNLSEDFRSLLPIVDMSLTSFGQHSQELAGNLLGLIESSPEGVAGFRSRFPVELNHIQAFAPNQPELGRFPLSVDKVLDAFDQAAKPVPQLPVIIPTWNNDSKIRSMLSPIPEGYRSHSREDFKDSFMSRNATSALVDSNS